MQTDCEYCKTIPWANFTSWTARGMSSYYLDPNPRPVLDFDKLQSSKCNVCETLSTMRIDGAHNVLTYDDRMYEDNLYLNESLVATLRVHAADDSARSSEYIGITKKGLTEPVNSYTRHVDWTVPRLALSDCRARGPIKDSGERIGYRMHTICRAADFHIIEGLRVIDCEHNLVIPAPADCSYLALSYVWGTNPISGRVLSNQLLFEKLERTIQDAITATKRLGFRYLWIDRYCIDQEDTAAKQQQIEQMCAIYSSALVTLIAAAGDSPEHGLPGVSLPRSRVRWAANRGPLTLTFRDVTEIDEIMQSVWASRAWTFQENFISQRRLFFTDSSTFFICKAHLVSEVGISGTGSFIDIHQRLDSMLATAVTYENRYKKRSGVRKCIETYSTRSLTYDTDALNAILGVLIHLAQDDACPTYHIWGVPITAVDPDGPFRRRFPNCYEVNLHWYHTGSSRRRVGFPSWSPIAWQGHLKYTGGIDCPNIVPMLPSDYDIVLPHEEGPRSLQQYIETGQILRNSALHSAPSSLILTQIRAFPVAVEERSSGVEAVLNLEDKVDVICPVFWDKVPLETHETELLGVIITTYQHGDISIMVLESRGNHYERVGMILWGYRAGTYTLRDRNTSKSKVVRSSRDRLMHPPQFLSERRQDVAIA